MYSMARGHIDVSFAEQDFTRLPDPVVPGATSLLDLQQAGVLDMVGELLQIRRQGGFCGMDVFVGLFLYYSSGLCSGLKKFWETVARGHAEALGALAGRDRLMSPSSMSRALGAVEIEALRPMTDTLLHTVAEVDEVLRHPAVQSYDALGNGWHVFDIDPTVTALRHRALPVGDELPEPVRRSEELAKPGYKGRKRGDVVLRRSTVGHAGSSLWLHGHLAPGNGDGLDEDFGRCLDTVVATCERLEHPLQRALVRMDGEYGNVPWFTACRERGLPFVTRLNRPHLFTDPEVLKGLREACWVRVPDSLAGPKRSAVDLGTMTLHAGKDTRRPDGSRYEPIDLRIVAVIFEKKGQAKRGRTIDGREVELFAVDLPADAWPAAEAIAAYYARNGIENRFAQEDRELGLDRIMSYHLPGQELATVVALAVWNYLVVRGFQINRPPETRPLQAPRHAVVDDTVPEAWPCDPVLTELLDEVDWDSRLSGRPGWSFDRATGELECEDGRRLVLTTVRGTPRSPNTTSVIFRRPAGGCEACEPRPHCLRSERPQASKHVEVSVPTELAERIRARLEQLRHRPERPRFTPIEASPGPYAVQHALFLPAEARHAFRELFIGATLRVLVQCPPPPPRLRLVADDDADRQRRRKTWAQNVARHALPDGARVRLDIEGGRGLRRLLQDRSDPQDKVNAAS
jgi:hypothetical protein